MNILNEFDNNATLNENKEVIAPNSSVRYTFGGKYV